VYSSSVVVVGVFFWLPVLTALVTAKAKSARQRAQYLLALLFSIALPASRWSYFQRLSFWTHVERYFKVRLVGAQMPTRVGKTIIGVAPHGLIPYSLGLLAFGKLQQVFHEPQIVVASATRFVPVFSHVLRLGGAIDASYESVNTALASSPLATIAVTPGGIGEMFYGYPQHGCSPNEEYAVLNNRKGFVRLALQHGAQLVPVFCFGASKIMKRIVLPKLFQELSVKLRASLVLFFGRWGLPIPFEVPLMYAVGRAISTQQNALPSTEEVDFTHNIYKLELLNTFEAHKEAYGWQDKRLVIV